MRVLRSVDFLRGLKWPRVLGRALFRKKGEVAAVPEGLGN